MRDIYQGILFIISTERFVFLPFVFRYGSITTQSGRSRNFCGEEAPFAVLIPGSYVDVRLNMYENYKGLKTLYFVMSNTGSDGM